jgi:ABC-type nitrate/sulfonate/bicarbonate transport system substrate-binding protein
MEIGMQKTISFTRRALLVAAVALAAVPMLAFDRAYAQDVGATPITIALSSNAFPYGGLFIAEKAGLFAKHGLQPKIVVMDSGNAAMTALIAGSAQFSGSGPGEVLAARSRGQNIVIVVNFYRGLSASVIMSKAVADKLNVAANAPVKERLRALDGLTIAAPSATSAYLHPVKAAAEEAGAKVKFVYMAQPAMVAAIQTGAIQGMIAASPYAGVPVAKGTGVVWISGPKGEFPANVQPSSSACLQTSEQYAIANPQIIARMRAVLSDLAKYIKDKPEDAKRNLAAAYPQVDSAAIDQAFAQDAGNWAKPELSEADIQQEIRILAATGLVVGVSNVKPSAVLWNK